MSGKRSLVHGYFTSADGDNKKCTLCDQTVSVPTGNTSNLKKHLERHHKKEFKELLQEEESSKKRRSSCQPASYSIEQAFAGSNKYPATHPKQEKINTLIAKMMGKDLQPFSMVDDTGFKDLIRELDPRYTLPHRTTFSRTIVPQLYNGTKQKVMDKLQNDSPTSIAITSDIWTSRAAVPFISMTAHYMTADFKKVNFLLDIDPFREEHTALNILQKWDNVFEDYSIDCSKIRIYCVTDNAANYRAALRKINQVVFGVKCFAHTLQLVVRDIIGAIPDLDRCIKKGQKIVANFNYSPKRYEILKKFQRQAGIEESKLVQSVETRWNSEFLMEESLVKNKEAITLALLELKIDGRTSEDWEYAESYLKIMEPFFKATSLVGSDKYCSISAIVPFLYSIRCKLEKQKKSSSNELKKIAAVAEAKLELRFPEMLKTSDIHSTATLLDPRFKNLIVKLGAESAQTLLNRFFENEEDSSSDVDSNPQSEGEDDDIWGPLRALSASQREPETRGNSALLAELRLYLNEKVLKTEDDPFQYWKIKKDLFPNLAKMAQSVLGVPGAATASERVWSTSGNTMTNRRESLKTDSVKFLVFLHENL